MMHGKLTASWTERASEKAVSNRDRGRGSGPDHPLNKVELAKSRLLGRLAGREAADNGDNIMVDLAYRERKWGSDKARKDLTFTLRDQTQIRHSGQLLFVPPSLLIGPIFFDFTPKTWHIVNKVYCKYE